MFGRALQTYRKHHDLPLSLKLKCSSFICVRRKVLLNKSCLFDYLCDLTMKRKSTSGDFLDKKSQEFEEMMMEKLVMFNKTASHSPLDRLQTEYNKSTSYGKTFVDKYARNGKLHRLRWILDRGAEKDPYVYYPNRVTYGPLHVAIYVGNQISANELLRRGASVCAKNSSNSTPLRIAVEQGLPHMAQLLFDYGAAIDSEAVEKAAKILNNEVMDVLFANGLTAEYLSPFKPMCQIIWIIFKARYMYTKSRRAHMMPLHLDMLKTLLTHGSHKYEPDLLALAFSRMAYDAIAPLLSVGIRANEDFFQTLKPRPFPDYLAALKLVAIKGSFIGYSEFDETFRKLIALDGGRTKLYSLYLRSSLYKTLYKEFIFDLRGLQSTTLFERCALKFVGNSIRVDNLPNRILNYIGELRKEYNTFYNE
jgi:hypothetical protein